MEAELTLMMTEVCGATNYIMMEVGGASSSMIKERGATKSNSRNYYYMLIFIFVVIDMENVYFMMRRKLLHASTFIITRLVTTILYLRHHMTCSSKHILQSLPVVFKLSQQTSYGRVLCKDYMTYTVVSNRPCCPGNRL